MEELRGGPLNRSLSRQGPGASPSWISLGSESPSTQSGGEAVFVGREHELARLEAALDDALAGAGTTLSDRGGVGGRKESARG